MVYRYQDFDRRSIGGGLNFGRRFFDFSSFSLGYKYEDVKVDDFSQIVPQIFKDNASGTTSGSSSRPTAINTSSLTVSRD